MREVLPRGPPDVDFKEDGVAWANVVLLHLKDISKVEEAEEITEAAMDVCLLKTGKGEWGHEVPGKGWTPLGNTAGKTWTINYKTKVHGVVANSAILQWTWGTKAKCSRGPGRLAGG